MPLQTSRIVAIVGLVLGAMAACTPTGGAEWATVKWVADGDTILLSDGRRVRYIGIDTPEIDHERRRAEAFGLEAREANRSLVAGQRIQLAGDHEPRDRYGRQLFYVYLADGTLVNAELLNLGLAIVLYKDPNTTLFSRLLEAQRNAMRAKRGLWQNADMDGPAVVGNRNSRRFHLASCPGANKIHPSNRLVFQKKWDAYWDGYSPARDCIPRKYQQN